MSIKTKIKKDFLGLYVNAEGTIARPYFGTKFSEGDEVKAHDFGGCRAGVTTLDNNFKVNIGKYEKWWLSGTTPSEYRKKTKEDIVKDYNWYKNDSNFYYESSKEHNMSIEL